MKALGDRLAGVDRRSTGTTPSALRVSSWPAVGLAVGVTLLGWLVTFVKSGSGLDLSVEDYVERANELPSVLIVDDPLADYRNWSILPLAIARLAGVQTVTGFAVLQCVVMVAGSTAVVGLIAWRRPYVAGLAALAMFATMAPSYAMRFMGSYDQVLLVALLAVAVVDTRWVALLLGVAIGLTHAEVGLIGLTGLTLLAAVGIGAPVRVRLCALGGLVGARVALMIALTAAGQPSDRLSFVREYGVSRMAGYYASTWPAIVLAIAGGGWLILAAATVHQRSIRLAAVLLGVVLATLAVTALTIDQSRVAMFACFPVVVALGSAAPLADRAAPWWARAAVPVAAVAGLALPLVVSWLGDYWYFGAPLFHEW